MRINTIAVLVFLFSVVSIDSGAQPNTGKNLSVSWRVMENHHDDKSQFLSALTLANTGKSTFPSSGWTLYFNFVRNILPGSVTGGVAIDRVNGDLFRLRPLPEFKAIAPGKKIEIQFAAADWVVNFTDAPAGLYLVWDSAPTHGVAIERYVIEPSTEPKQYLRFPQDKIGLVTPDMIFAKNETITSLPDEAITKIFPTPKKYDVTKGNLDLMQISLIQYDPAFGREADYLADELTVLLKKKPVLKEGTDALENAIVIRKGESSKEGYTLKVNGNTIHIRAADGAGVFYAIQSLKTLVPARALRGDAKEIMIPACEVSDEPRFPHRAFFLDVSRNFQSKAQILKLIDLMSLYKLNVLHFHLNDDEGWRLEIPGLPELTEVGSRRGHTLDNSEFLQPSFGSGPDINNPAGSGFYSKADYLEILKYATTRHITVIPEIETPGHARAAIKSMEARYQRMMKAGKPEEASEYRLHHPDDQSVYRSVQGWNDNVIDVGMPSAYRFLEKVVDEISAMYVEAQAPLQFVHFGGDEVPAGVWEKSPACRKVIDEDPKVNNVDDLWYYYFGKINAMLKRKNLKLYGWEEIAMRKTTLDGARHFIPNPDFIPDQFQVDVWNNVLGWGSEDLAYKLANSGYKVVLSCVTHLYFDMAYYKAFDEPGYYWGAFVDVDKPFSFIPYDYFRNATEDRFGGPLDRSVFVGKERLTEFGKQNIIGIQGLLWSENMNTPERMEYMTLPKIFGVAERAWAQDPAWATEKNPAKAKLSYDSAWTSFINTVGKRELPRLDFYHGGYLYRIPAPGAIVENGSVIANIQFPGLEIRYTTDGKDPDSKSKKYNGPVKGNGTVKLRAFDSRGRGGKVSVVKIAPINVSPKK
jgi:hexosaminidase